MERGKAGKVQEDAQGVDHRTVTVMMDDGGVVRATGGAVGPIARSVKPRPNASGKRHSSAVWRRLSVRPKKPNATIALFL